MINVIERMNEMVSEEVTTVAFLKSKLPTLQSMYTFLKDEGWFLPEFQNKNIMLKLWSQKYLLNLLQDKAYKIKRNSLKIPKTLK